MSPGYAKRPTTTELMAPSISRVRAVVAAALVALAAVLAVTATASAAFPEPRSDHNIDSRDLKLPIRPDASACIRRTIDLDGGSYLWQSGANVESGRWFVSLPKVVSLKRGTYAWKDCAVGDIGGAMYVHYSYLNGPSSFNGPRVGWGHRAGTYDVRFGSTLKQVLPAYVWPPPSRP